MNTSSQPKPPTLSVSPHTSTASGLAALAALRIQRTHPAAWLSSVRSVRPLRSPCGTATMAGADADAAAGADAGFAAGIGFAVSPAPTPGAAASMTAASAARVDGNFTVEDA